MLNETHGIIGYGEMGDFVTRMLLDQGIPPENITLHHLKEGISIPEGVSVGSLEDAVQAHIRWHCGPLAQRSELLKESGRFTRQSGTVDVELASLKKSQAEILEQIRAPEGHTCQWHPMHKGLKLENLQGERSFITYPKGQRNSANVAWGRDNLAPILEGYGEKVLYWENSHHDSVAASVQGLRMLSLLGLGITTASYNWSESFTSAVPANPDYGNLDKASHEEYLLYINIARLFAIPQCTVTGLIQENERVSILAKTMAAKITHNYELFHMAGKGNSGVAQAHLKALKQGQQEMAEYVTPDLLEKAKSLHELMYPGDPTERYRLEGVYNEEIVGNLNAHDYMVASCVALTSMSFFETLEEHKVPIQDVLTFMSPALDLSLRSYTNGLLHTFKTGGMKGSFGHRLPETFNQLATSIDRTHHSYGDSLPALYALGKMNQSPDRQRICNEESQRLVKRIKEPDLAI